MVAVGCMAEGGVGARGPAATGRAGRGEGADPPTGGVPGGGDGLRTAVAVGLPAALRAAPPRVPELDHADRPARGRHRHHMAVAVQAADPWYGRAVPPCPPRVHRGHGRAARARGRALVGSSGQPSRREPEMDELTDVLYEVEDGLATITINRPERMNAFRARTVDELIHC